MGKNNELREAYINYELLLADLPRNQTPEIQAIIAKDIGEIVIAEAKDKETL